MKTLTIVLAILTVLFGFGVLMLLTRTRDANAPAGASTIVDGTQIIDITARGGYAPRVVTAKANMPTILRVATRGTFDCSSALTIPAIGYRGNLPPSGTTDIPVPPQAPGATLQGICAMGMYSFAVRFE